MSNSQLRIATLSLHSSPLADLGGETAGGMSVFVREVNRELGRLGLQLDIFTRRDNPSQSEMVEIDKGVRLIRLSAGPAVARSRNELSQDIPLMRQALREWPAEAYDVIHAHYWISGAVGRQWAAEKGIPFVQMFHTIERTKGRLIGNGYTENKQRSGEEEALGRQADALTVGSGRDRESLISDYGIPQEKIHVVPGGVNPHIFSPRSPDLARRRAGLAKCRVALFVGRIEPVKGLETLIQALAHLRREGGDHCSWRVVLIGGNADSRQAKENGDLAGAQTNDSYIDHIHKLALDLGMADRLTFLGPKPQEFLADYYAGADCCVFPSVYETFGLAVIEALACGGVVVASDIGGYPQILSEEKAGLLVPPGDPNALARALDRVCTDSALREGLRRRAPEVGRRFSWSETAQRFLKIYRVLVENHSAQSIS
jgi:D-inositol-3-phosphate glycosyltransferase